MGDQLDSKRIKDIKIKSGIVKRLAKEKTSYEKELEKQQQKVDSMKAEDSDDYNIKKQSEWISKLEHELTQQIRQLTILHLEDEQEVLEETRKMIPDCERRLVAAWDDLARLMESESDLKETEEYRLAELALEETKTACGR